MLRWSDLDLPGKALTIARSIVEAERAKLVERDTKTHAARRIALDVGTVDVRKTHRERCTARRKPAASGLPRRRTPTVSVRPLQPTWSIEATREADHLGFRHHGRRGRRTWAGEQ